MQQQPQQRPECKLPQPHITHPAYPILSPPLPRARSTTLQQCQLMLEQVDILERKIRSLERRYARRNRRRADAPRRLRRKRQDMRFNYKCLEGECGKVYASPTSLKLHMRRKHGRVVSREEIVRQQINPE